MTGSNKGLIAGWVLSGLLGVFLIGVSAGGKLFLMPEPDKSEMLAKMGFSNELMTKIAIVEIVITILFLIPRTAFIGAILITAYLGGAVCTHVRIGDAYIFPVLLGVILWVALGLRQRGVFALAFPR